VGIPDAQTIFAAHRQKIQEVIPDADVYLTGSASVVGLDAGDIDLVALVPDVLMAASRLQPSYIPLYEEQWSDDWAAVRMDGAPQVDVVLTRQGTKWDLHHRLAWDLLRGDEQLLAEYAALKAVPTSYAERKALFFERVVRLLTPRP